MRVLVVVPTYQEADNIAVLLRAVRATMPEASVLVLDDDSPDGTGALAEEVGAEVGNVTVLHRTAKEGLGAAYREGFAWALAHDIDVVVQMDCDLSHDPGAIPALVERLDHPTDPVECVIGSRYVPGGSTPNWPLHRRLLSRYGNRYTAAVLGLGVHDVTSGFRAYRVEALRAIHPETTRSSGYAFMSELARRLAHEGHPMAEVPITFVDRAYGTSKMSVAIMAESLTLVTAWGVKERLRRLRRRGRP
ncbi:MAG TPA: polyprenol monophosphomannose synthase [Acidimicrobiales bacterium]|nr:polyprenol monophosphomannose synthase [Acidimicrobiales bacterium]HMS87187.1 polyprenol monophosphomannose synthase [Acidimicrobiales bacterium]HRA35571.1 polyprenol monophosphomannose synthase [Acidimicrobiales bacterium]